MFINLVKKEYAKKKPGRQKTVRPNKEEGYEE